RRHTPSRVALPDADGRVGPGAASGIRRAHARAVLRPRVASRGEGRTLGAAGSAGGGERASARVAEPFRALSFVGTGTRLPMRGKPLRSKSGMEYTLELWGESSSARSAFEIPARGR